MLIRSTMRFRRRLRRISVRSYGPVWRSMTFRACIITSTSSRTDRLTLLLSYKRWWWTCPSVWLGWCRSPRTSLATLLRTSSSNKYFTPRARSQSSVRYFRTASWWAWADRVPRQHSLNIWISWPSSRFRTLHNKSNPSSRTRSRPGSPSLLPILSAK